MRILNSIFLGFAAAAITSTAFAQTDPKLQSNVIADPATVSLSRNSIDAGSVFIARAAYRVTIKNGAANYLNRASFNASTSVVELSSDTPVDGAGAPFDIAVQFIQVSGETANCVVGGTGSTSVSCNFGDSQLAPDDTSVFILVVKSPFSGGRIKLDWNFGGDEGKGGGNGCCTKFDKTYTGLIDPVANPEQVNRHAQSFMVQTVLDKAFTGTTGGVATEADPWATYVDLKAAYVERPYAKLTLDELLNVPTLGSCSALNLNKCWISNISIPDTTWTVANPLIIRLDRHSSIIKNGSKLSNYILQYSKTPDVAGSFTNLQSCSLGTPEHPAPALGVPCVDKCDEIPLTSKPSPYIWRCTIKALDNGGYRAP